jgi:hypothetical protein
VIQTPSRNLEPFSSRLSKGSGSAFGDRDDWEIWIWKLRRSVAEQAWPQAREHEETTKQVIQASDSESEAVSDSWPIPGDHSEPGVVY